MNWQICTFDSNVLLFLLDLLINSAADFLPGYQTDEVLALLISNIFSVKFDHAAREKDDLIAVLGNIGDRIVLQIEHSEPVHSLQYGANILLKVAY